MEQLFKLLKEFLIRNVNLKIEDDLPKFTDNNIQFGAIDPFKNPAQKMICSIYPNSQSDASNNIDEIRTASSFTLTVVSKNNEYEKLLSQTCEYTALLLKAFNENYTLSFSDDEHEYFVDEIIVGNRKFYPDAGIAEKQATAVEIELTIYTVQDI